MNKYDRQHVRNISRYQKQMEKILDEAFVEAAKLRHKAIAEFEQQIFESR